MHVHRPSNCKNNSAQHIEQLNILLHVEHFGVIRNNTRVTALIEHVEGVVRVDSRWSVRREFCQQVSARTKRSCAVCQDANRRGTVMGVMAAVCQARTSDLTEAKRDACTHLPILIPTAAVPAAGLTLN